MKENGNAKFICAAKYVKEWMFTDYKNNVEYNPDIPNSVQHNNELHILKAKRKNQGQYECNGEIKDGRFYAVGQLIIVCK